MYWLVYFVYFMNSGLINCSILYLQTKSYLISQLKIWNTRLNPIQMTKKYQSFVCCTVFKKQENIYVTKGQRNLTGFIVPQFNLHLELNRSSAEILGSNPTTGMDNCLLRMSFVVMYRSLGRADHSSRGVLPTVVRRCVWSRNINNRCSIYIWH